IIVDVLQLQTRAYIADGARVNLTGASGGASQTIAIAADDHTNLVNIAGSLAFTTGSAGVGVSIIVEVLDKDVYATIGNNALVSAGGDVTLNAFSTEELFVLAVAGAASTDDAAVNCAIIVVVDNKVGTHKTSASIGHDTTL